MAVPKKISIPDDLIYENIERLQKVKALIAKGDQFFSDAYGQLITEANEELGMKANPVIKKTKFPPSGDEHDYMSIAPYRWPDPEAKDGFPWIVRDGEINPMSRGNDTDKVRLSAMFGALRKLSMAYFFSDEMKYANKAKSIIETWFIDDATKVNPNINFGQGIPGEVEGRRAGIIEWRSISTVITTIQLLESNDLLSNDEMQIFKGAFQFVVF